MPILQRDEGRGARGELEAVENGGEFARGVADWRHVDHPPEDLLIYSESPERVAVRCESCEGSGFSRDVINNRRGLKLGQKRNPASCRIGCEDCQGAGFLGIDGELPTSCRAGSEGKISVMAARYSQGLSLFQSGDLDLRDVISVCLPLMPDSHLVNAEGVSDFRNQDLSEQEFDDEELVADAA